MHVTHVNRNREAYYLHAGSTKTGKPRYWFAKNAAGCLVESIPDGFEVYENPDSQVFLRKTVPQLVTPAEVAVVEDGLKRHAPGQNCLVDIQGKQIVIHHAERVILDPKEFGIRSTELPTFNHRYMKVMQFILVNDNHRTFRVQRWCFRGSIDRWIDLFGAHSPVRLADLVKRYCPHIGQDSFFELM